MTLLAGTLAAIALLGCDSGGPGSGGNFTFAATLDGHPWVADTMVAIAFAAPTDTSIIISAARRASPTRDSLVSGSFAFEASTHPDTIAHRRGSGTFMVRYSMQRVFVP